MKALAVLVSFALSVAALGLLVLEAMTLPPDWDRVVACACAFLLAHGLFLDAAERHQAHLLEEDARVRRELGGASGG